MKREIIFYETESGACPVAKFLRKQISAVKDAVAAAFTHIEADSNSDHLFQKMVNTDDLWEIRVRQNRDIFRVLCFFDGAALVVVASGFQKKTQKTPSQEIKTAEARKKEYFRRKRNG
jgi:phage-related protein